MVISHLIERLLLANYHFMAQQYKKDIYIERERVKYTMTWYK